MSASASRKLPPPRAYAPQMFLYAELYRIARFLMAENPREAELSAWDPPDLEPIIANGYTVAELRFPGQRGSSEYIVFNGETRYTTDSIPDDFTGTVEVWEIPEPNGFAGRRLRVIGRALRKLAPRVYEQKDVSDILQAVAEWERLSSIQAGPELALQQCMGELQPSQTSPDVVGNAGQLYKAVSGRFLNCRLAGTDYQKAGGTLVFFANHPEPNALRSTLTTMVEITAMQKAFGKPGLVIIPPLDLNFYLSHPNTAGEASCLAATTAAQRLRKTGGEFVRKALRASTIWDFHSQLYYALAVYRGAFEILSRIKFLTERVPSIWAAFPFDERTLHRWWVECEEARVTILASLREAALGRRTKWNVGRPNRLIYIASTLVKEHGAPKAFETVQDICVRLVIPKFVSDILMGVVSATAGVEMARHTARIARVVAELENDLKKSVLLGDPMYLEQAYAVGRWLTSQTGNTEVARDFKTGQAALAGRVRSIWQNATTALHPSVVKSS